MPQPKDITVWKEALDPRDRKPYTIDCKKFLGPGENIISHSVIVPAESVLAGLVIDVAPYVNTVADGIITIWPQIADAKQEALEFYGDGLLLPITLTIESDSSPAKRLQRTYAVRVQQR